MTTSRTTQLEDPYSKAHCIQRYNQLSVLTIELIEVYYQQLFDVCNQDTPPPTLSLPSPSLLVSSFPPLSAHPYLGISTGSHGWNQRPRLEIPYLKRGVVSPRPSGYVEWCWLYNYRIATDMGTREMSRTRKKYDVRGRGSVWWYLIAFSFLVSQNWTVSSQPADTSRWGSPGWYLTANTRLMWPSMWFKEELKVTNTLRHGTPGGCAEVILTYTYTSKDTFMFAIYYQGMGYYNSILVNTISGTVVTGLIAWL